MGKCFKDLLRRFDYFGVQFTFKIKDSNSYGSRFGGTVFILFILFFISTFFLTFFDFYERNVYSVNYSIAVLKPAPQIHLKKLGFNFAYALRYDNDTVPESKILDLFDINVFSTYINNSNADNKTKTIINTKICDQSDLEDSTDFGKEFKNLDLARFNCCEIKENISIAGTYADSIYSYIDFGILIKNQFFNNDTTIQFLTNFFSQNPLKLVLYWVDTTIQVRNYDNPISTYLRPFVSYLDFNSIKKINLDFSIIEYSSDENYLMQIYNKSNYISFQESQEFSFISNNRKILGNLGRTILKFFFRASPKNVIIDRKYQKLSEFMANLGGINSNLLMILFVIVGFVNKFWAEQKLINKLLKFREHLKFTHPTQYNLLKNNLNDRVNIHNPSTINNINKNNDLSSQDFNINNMKKFEESQQYDENKISMDSIVENMEKILPDRNLTIYKRQINKIDNNEIFMFNNSGKPISFNSYEIILRYCPCKTKKFTLKQKLHKKASKKMDYYFDIFTYVKKMQEIDLIKYLLLDKDQVKLFNFISKPSISMSYSNSDDIYINYQKNRLIKSKLKIEELDEIIQSYKVLENKTDKITNRLYYLFDYEINHLLIG